jgi:hypothetical protein
MGDVSILVWLGIWSAMYGVLHLGDSLVAVARLPHWIQVSALYLDTVIVYLVLVVATRVLLSRGTSPVALVTGRKIGAHRK